MANNDMMHQGKSIAQWAKEFKGKFSEDQLVKMARGGCDLQKILMLGLDESDDITPNEGLPGEESMMFEDDDHKSIKDYLLPNCQIRIYDENGNEIFWTHMDIGYLKCLVPYIGTGVCGYDLKTQAGALLPDDAIMNKYAGQTITTMVYCDGEPLSMDRKTLASQLEKIDARAKTAIANLNKKRRINAGFSSLDEVSREDELAAFNESNGDNVVTLGDFIDNAKRTYAKDSDKIMFRVAKKAYDVFDMHSKGGVLAVDLIPAIANGLDLKEDDNQEKEDKDNMNEGRNWRNGGYGGYGRSFRSYGEVGAPRGKAISWFNVAELDPKAAGKMMDWRVGPSNFPFKDLLYPDRKYKTGTTVLRSKFMKAGDESGVKYIAVPSYLDAIKNNDEAAIELLKALNIPLDLTFGYNADEDFSATYTTTK